MVEYGEKVGVGKRWTENIPVDDDYFTIGSFV